MTFDYAVVASWISETEHPAHAPEACGISVTVTPDIYFSSMSDKGGKLKIDMSFLRTWGEVPSTIFIESDVLSAPHQMTAGGSEMIPVGGGAGYSTYHVEIPADNLNSNSNTSAHEFWVIPEYDNFNYKNASVTNGAGGDKLAAFFRYDLFVAATSYDKPPVAQYTIVTAMPVVTWISPIPVAFHSTSYDPDPGDTLTYAWDFDGDGIYGEAVDDKIDSGTPSDPVHNYGATYSGQVNLKVIDQSGAFGIASQLVNVTLKTTCGSGTPLPIPSTYTGNIGNYNSSYDYYGAGDCYFEPLVTRSATGSSRRIIYPYYSYSLGIMKADTYQYLNDVNSGWPIYRAVITSTDKVIYCDDSSKIQLWSADYGSDNFTNVYTTWGTTIPQFDGYVPYSNPGAVQMAIDENDQPIILAVYYAYIGGKMGLLCENVRLEQYIGLLGRRGRSAPGDQSVVRRKLARCLVRIRLFERHDIRSDDGVHNIGQQL